MLWAEIAAAAVTVAARLPQTVCRQTVASPSILLPSGSSVPSLPRWRGGLRPLSAFLGTYESLLGSLGRGRAKSSSAYPCRARSVAEPGRQRHEPRQRDNISRQSSVALAAWGALGGDTACSPAANCCPPRRLVTTHPKVQLLSREARGSSVQEVFRKGGSQSLDLRLVSGPSVVGSLEHQQVAGHEVTHGNDLTWKGVQMPGSPSATKDGHQEQGSGEPTPATPSAGGNDAASALKKGRSEAMGPQGGNKGALLLNRHLKGCRDISSVAMLVKGAHPFELTDINVAAALEKIATLISRARGRDLKETEHTRTAIQRLTRQLNDQLGVFRPRALALSLHALGRLRESRVFKVAAASARKRLGEFDAQGLADLACASVAVQRPHGELLKAIEAEILRRLAGGASFCR